MLTFADEFIVEGFSKTPRTNLNAMFKTCPVCGKEFRVIDKREYRLKTYDGKKIVYFEKESCMRKFLANVDCKIKRRKHIGAEAMERYRQRRMEKIKRFGKTFWEDWQNGLTIKKIAEKHQCKEHFVYKWIHAYREAMI